MPIIATALLDRLFGNKKKDRPAAAYIGRSGRAPATPAPPPVTDPLNPGMGPFNIVADLARHLAQVQLANPTNSGSTLDPRAEANDWLNQALAIMGGGPDRDAYIRPFDEAQGRAQQAFDATLPQLASTYASLRDQLGANQQEYQGLAAQQLANQQQSQPANQQLYQQLTAPVIADLQRQGGDISVGSLVGGQQAQVATQQAQMQQQGAAQQQLSQNLTNAANQSFDSRLQDTHLAESNAASNARTNLNAILNQIGVQRAGAERQFAADQTAFNQQRGQLGLQASQMERELAAQQNDPMKALQYEKMLLDIAQGRQRLEEITGTRSTEASNALRQFHMALSQSNPISYDYLSNLGAQADSLSAVLAQINRDTGSDGNVRHQGRKLNANALREWAIQLDELSSASSSK